MRPPAKKQPDTVQACSVSTVAAAYRAAVLHPEGVKRQTPRQAQCLPPRLAPGARDPEMLKEGRKAMANGSERAFRTAFGMPSVVAQRLY